MGGRTDRADRVVAAPASAVYAALLDPGALTAWLPPEGMTGSVSRFDARPGGGYAMVLRYADGSAAGKTTADEDVVDVRFVSLEEDHRVVQAVDFVAQDPAFGGTMTMTWTLTPVEGGTLVEVRADDVPAGIDPDDHAIGMASSLAQLAEHVECGEGSEGSHLSTRPAQRQPSSGAT